MGVGKGCHVWFVLSLLISRLRSTVDIIYWAFLAWDSLW